MAIIQFEDGTKVEVQGTPTPADIDYIYSQIKRPQETLESKLASQDTGFFSGLGARTAQEQLAGAKHIKETFQKGVSNMEEGASKGTFGGKIQQLKGAAQTVFGGISGAAQALFAPATAVVNPILKKVAPVAEKLQPYTQIVSDPIKGLVMAKLDPILKEKITPKIQELLDKNPDNTQLVGDIVNTLLLGVGGESKSVTNALKEGTSKEALKLSAQSIKEIPDTFLKTASKVENVFTPATFEQNLNKAIPVLKKDITNLPQKVSSAKVALTDIAKNKESIGLVDKNGAPRNPENFIETVEAQQKRKPEIYKEYTDKLSEVDKPKFEADISNSIKDQIKNVEDKLVVENSIDNRRALNKIKGELSTLRDISPKGIQDYIQTINQKVKPLAPGGSLTPEQIQYANLGGDLRKLLDSSIEKIDGTGYQDVRNVYSAHKNIESQLLMAAKKEMNAIPGFTEKLGNVGLTLEGLDFLLTHNPKSLVIGGGIKGISKLVTWLNSPQRALKNLFKEVETQIKPSLSSPQATNTIANTVKINPISKSVPLKK
ncbi:MAG: hypothetical protein ACR2IQ_02640 [Minisyncoccia bacterium]